jgi:hypothetical protein
VKEEFLESRILSLFAMPKTNPSQDVALLCRWPFGKTYTEADIPCDRRAAGCPTVEMGHSRRQPVVCFGS